MNSFPLFCLYFAFPFSYCLCLCLSVCLSVFVCLCSHPETRRRAFRIHLLLGKNISKKTINLELQLDENGCPICPLCNEKVAESKWEQHVRYERENLVTIIGSVKCHKLSIEAHSSTSTLPTPNDLKKREIELNRIRSNQQKRINLKRGAIAGFRDSLTPYSRQSNEESGTSESPEIKKEDDSFSNLKCSVCQNSCEFAIVTSQTDRPRCQQCFGAGRLLVVINSRIVNLIIRAINF
ncbi:hypothetical protein WR25_03091 isoform B [Diploscapter pachys]|uniref:Uncharacterized protein n=1 Tax=Diploscapter pachys TaxID=2018661 RepID=A0A2A2L632_9BILA|nr:hypothetical protein WR25_03091 isoform B [Diploscapter pachys]